MGPLAKSPKRVNHLRGKLNNTRKSINMMDDFQSRLVTEFDECYWYFVAVSCRLYDEDLCLVNFTLTPPPPSCKQVAINIAFAVFQQQGRPVRFAFCRPFDDSGAL